MNTWNCTIFQIMRVKRTRAIIGSSLVLFLIFNSLGTNAQQQSQPRLLQQPELVRAWPSKAKRWALVIGVDQYDDGNINPLRGAANDARALAGALVVNAGFPADQVILLTTDEPRERRPTRINILLYLSNLASAVPKDGLLLVSFAGHGIERGGQAYLIPADARLTDDVSLLEDSAVSVSRVHNRIRATGVGQVVVLLDACRNDPGGRTEAPNPLTPAYIQAFNFDVRNREVQAFATIYATAVGERAYEFAERKQGYFTWAVVAALKGAAANDHGEVTLASLVRYVQDNVPKRVAIDLGPSKKQFPFANIEGYQAEALVLAVSIAKMTNPPGITTPSSTGAVSFPDPANPSFTSNAVASDGPKLAKENLDQANALTTSGDAHRMKSENDLAVKDFTEAIRFNPNYAMAYALRGLTYESKGKTDLALIDLTQAIRIDPTFAWYYSQRSGLYRKKGEFDLALSDIDEVIRLVPGGYFHYKKRAEIYRLLDRKDLAIADEKRRLTDANEAILRNPNSSQAYLDRCDTYRTESQLDLAIKDCNQAINLDLTNGAAHAIRGSVHQMKGNHDLAIADFTRTLQLDIGWEWVYWVYVWRAATYRSVGLKILADQDEQQAQTIGPDYLFWSSIASGNDPEKFRAYKRAFPNGRYITIADETLRRLESAKFAGNSSSLGTSPDPNNSHVRLRNDKSSEVIAPFYGPTSLGSGSDYYIQDERGKYLQVKFTAKVISFDDGDQLKREVSRNTGDASHVWNDKWYYWRLPQPTMLLLAWRNITQKTEGWVLVQKYSNVWRFKYDHDQQWKVLAKGGFTRIWAVGGKQISISIDTPNSGTPETSDDIKYNFGTLNAVPE